jgi:hypothetical protein
MDYPYEEIYLNSGQFDPIIHITFKFGSEAFKRYGYQVMGTILYTHDERRALQELIENTPKEEFPKTDGTVRFNLSKVGNWDEQKAKDLERYGFLCSEIFLLTDYGWNRINRFAKKGEKEIVANQYTIEVDGSGWSYKGMIKATHDILDRRIAEGHSLAPFEVAELLGYRKLLGLDNTIEPYSTLVQGIDPEEVEYAYGHALVSMYYNDNSFNPEEMDKAAVMDHFGLMIKRRANRLKFIEHEAEKSGESIKKLEENYKPQLDHIKEEALKFEGESFNIYGKLVYLTFEGLVHIYARHVQEMYIQGKREDNAKTFFQYKVGDVLSILRFNIESMKDEIDQHFKEKPHKQFFRKNSRANYLDGHYYRIDIDPDGSIIGFHPYNNNGPEGEPQKAE